MQVNSELATNPTDQFEVQMLYRIFIYSIVFLALTCISCYIFPKMPEQSPQHDNDSASSNSINNLPE